ncbi:phosphatidylserine/phosphatidylglycerophosphate/cardiolipin synthase-like enzyme [Methylorubrum rhodinum]|uniref:Phospholipase D n=1 Tax=Methylorubrum rhodinum TaxID=29428 RepID=A0A840ZHE1_9HYPH|nr:phospholipase D-like domain-containing protein [Methylorubrum rhodinum]MBB5756397.1 phosphatidylserine/phosphatidylglycerophosphate/cardiolipin synthase-like enzyme [Methylorubrum rhodinum]
MRRDIEVGGAPAPEGWLRPGLTCWRRERAHRAAVLHDGAAYFAAARAALVKAQRTITLIGWSFDPRVRLLPSAGDPDADQTLADLLRALKAARPNLTIRILIWDMPWPISAGNDHTPDSVRASLGTGIDFRIDDTLPYGACQHQKILVIDDRIAFCGGSDFEVNRWDTPAHRDRDPRRRLPSGEDYPPRHDVMMLVDGPAARALADLARERWRRATGETLSPTLETPVDPWPETVVPLLTEVEVGLSRTEPALEPRPERWFPAFGKKTMRHESRAAVSENAALYLATIRAAKEVIYLENQYLASPVVADALRARLGEPDGPEIVIVLSERSPNGFDQLTMDSARRGLIKGLRRADRHGRLRIVAPHTPKGQPILIHSKVAIIDHRFLRIGSTNLNNRSFGYDTECDLSIELRPDDAAGRAALDRVLHALLGHHGGCPSDTFAQAYAERGSLRAVIDDPALMPSPRLCTLVPSHRGPIARLVEAFHLGDPAGSDDAWRPWRRRRVLRRAHEVMPAEVAGTGAAVEA